MILDCCRKGGKKSPLLEITPTEKDKRATATPVVGWGHNAVQDYKFMSAELVLFWADL